MESHKELAEPVLIDSINYKLKNSSEYVTGRQSVSYFPSGSDTYSSTSGSKVMRFTLTGDDFLVPQTVRLQFDVNNTATDVDHILRPVSGPWSFFRRMRLLCRGVVIEDIDNYNRTHEMFNIFTSRHNRDNDDITGFGRRYDDETNYGVVPTTDYYKSVKGNSRRIVIFKPLSGLLSQEKWIPLRYMPITIELELVNSPTDCLFYTEGSTQFLTTGGSQNTSESWTLSNAMIKCDICMMDNSVLNQINEHIAKNEAIPFSYKTYITQYQTITAWNINIAIARAVGNLSAFFVSFNNNDEGTTDGFRESNKVLRDFNTFYNPMIGTSTVYTYDTIYDVDLELEYEFSIGGKKLPDYGIRSQSEAFTQLEKTIKDVYFDDYNSMSIRPREYISDKFIVGVNTTKVWKTFGSGIDTKNGDVLRIGIKPVNSSSISLRTPSRLRNMLSHISVLELVKLNVFAYCLILFIIIYYNNIFF